MAKKKVTCKNCGITKQEYDISFPKCIEKPGSIIKNGSIQVHHEFVEKDTKQKIHFDFDINETYKQILCKYTWWKNSGEYYPDWPTTCDPDKVTCKNCLKIIKSGMRCLDD